MAACAPITGTVFVLAEHAELSGELPGFLPAPDYRMRQFQTLAQLLDHPPPDSPSCLVAQFGLAGAGPLAIRNSLAGRGILLPVIFVLSCPDMAATVEAMKEGAFSVLALPLDPKQVRREIDAALARSEESLYRLNELDALRQRFGSLTSREAGLVPLVASGKPNKQIAAHLGIEQSTVKVHRSRVLRKMGAESAAQLALMAARLNLLPAMSGKRLPKQQQQQQQQQR